ncbi:MAG: hypothetical protein V4581_13555 [Bacteroidota bacterium]
MKTLLLLFLTCSLTAFSQEYKIPELQDDTIISTNSDYYSTLGITDRNAMIITAGNTGTFEHVLSRFIVYFKDGTVKKFTIHNSSGTVTELAVQPGEKARYVQFLNTCVTDERLQLDRILLTGGSFTVPNGTTDYFTVYHAGKALYLSSYASAIYIEHKAPGWQERQKLVDLIKTFEALFNNK